MVSLAESGSAVASYGFSVETIVEHYSNWVAEPFYVVVVGWNQSKADYEYAYFRSLKRGNSYYSYEVMCKFRQLHYGIEDKAFFTYGERDRRKIKSSVVLASLTYARTYDVEDTWRTCGEDYNRWITGLRRKYGDIDVVRCFESQTDGQCHIHAVLLFKEMRFQGFRWNKYKNGRRIITYRVGDIKPFRAGWKYGFSDFQLCHSLRGALKYISKYLTKSVSKDEENGKNIKTLALSWFFHRRSFSISGEIANVYSDLIHMPHDNSNTVVPHFELLDGSTLNCEVSRWRLYGFARGDDVKWGRGFCKIARDEVGWLVDEGFISLRENVSEVRFVG